MSWQPTLNLRRRAWHAADPRGVPMAQSGSALAARSSVAGEIPSGNADVADEVGTLVGP